MNTLQPVDATMTLVDKVRIESGFLELAVHVAGKDKIAARFALPNIPQN
jgi:hypothetical protein